MTSRHTRPRVSLALDSDKKDELERIARSEHRTLSTLLELLVLEGYERRKTKSPIENPKFLNAHDFLKIIAKRRPTDSEITEVAHSEDIEPDVLIEIRDCLYPTPNLKKANGTTSPS